MKKIAKKLYGLFIDNIYSEAVNVNEELNKFI